MKIPNSLYRALVRVISDLRKEWSQDIAQVKAEASTTIAEARAAVAEMRSAYLEKCQELSEFQRSFEISQKNHRESLEAAISALKPPSPQEVADIVLQSLPAQMPEEQIKDLVASEILRLAPDPKSYALKDEVAEVVNVLSKRFDTAEEVVHNLGVNLAEFRDENSFEKICAHVDERISQEVLNQEEVLQTLGETVTKQIEEQLAFELDKLPKPKDGKSVTVDDVMPELRESLKALVASIPVPKDGTSVTVDDVKPLIKQLVNDAVEAIPKPKDGVGLADAFQDKEGNLVVTMTNGAAKTIGKIQGSKGEDGFGFDDLSVAIDEDERTVLLSFKKEGRPTKTFRLNIPSMIYRGIYQQGCTYQRGDTTTFGGSLWHAEKSGQLGKPGDSSDWKLAVKRGRDGKSLRKDI